MANTTVAVLIRTTNGTKRTYKTAQMRNGVPVPVEGGHLLSALVRGQQEPLPTGRARPSGGVSGPQTPTERP